MFCFISLACELSHAYARCADTGENALGVLGIIVGLFFILYDSAMQEKKLGGAGNHRSGSDDGGSIMDDEEDYEYVTQYDEKALHEPLMDDGED